MDERVRRLWAGAEADAIGWGGVVAVARATGMAISTVRKGRASHSRPGARHGFRSCGAKVPEPVSLRKPGAAEQAPQKVARLALAEGESPRIRDDEPGPRRAERPEGSRQRGRQRNRAPSTALGRPHLAASDLLPHSVIVVALAQGHSTLCLIAAASNRAG
jgi:hypothetical protein